MCFRKKLGCSVEKSPQPKPLNEACGGGGQVSQEAVGFGGPRELELLALGIRLGVGTEAEGCNPGSSRVFGLGVGRRGGGALL